MLLDSLKKKIEGTISTELKKLLRQKGALSFENDF